LNNLLKTKKALYNFICNSPIKANPGQPGDAKSRVRNQAADSRIAEEKVIISQYEDNYARFRQPKTGVFIWK
jgi:hypothetical protein